jgi:hypothetical protein
MASIARDEEPTEQHVAAPIVKKEPTEQHVGAPIVKKEPTEQHVGAPVVKKEPTEQHVGAPVVKKEPTEQHVGGGGGGFGSILDFPRHRVLRGVAAPISTKQLQGLHDAINLTGDGDGDGAPASSFSERLDDQGVRPLAPWQMHACDM